MAPANLRPPPPPPFFIVLFTALLLISTLPQSSSQSSTSPRNIQVSYPFALPPPPPDLSPSPPPDLSPSPPPDLSPSPPPDLSPSPPGSVLPPPRWQPGSPSPSSSSTRRRVGAAIGITAATTLVLSGIMFFLIQRCHKRRKSINQSVRTNPYADRNRRNPIPAVVPRQDEFVRFNGNLKGLIVDQDGLDVIYWKKLEEGNKRFERERRIEEDKVQEKKVISNKSSHTLPSPEFPLLRGESSTSHSPFWNDLLVPYDEKNSSLRESNSIEKQEKFVIEITPRKSSSSSPSPPPLPPQTPPHKTAASPPPPPPPPTMAVAAISKAKSPPPPPPLPAAAAVGALPPPPPPILPKARTVTVATQSKPPPIPIFSRKKEAVTEENAAQVKLKPLHWDKVNRTNVDHSMVWDKIDNGSFKVDDNLMEALFGYVAVNKKSPRNDSSSSTPLSKDDKASSSSQVFILDTRKSQNTAIVLKSLAISREEIIEAVIHGGDDLSVDILEKLSRIAPTKEEEKEILAFSGDPARLADAESFLYYLLKSVPTAFARFNAMLFRSNFNTEVPHLKESFELLEMGCKELRARGLLLKLLEAILKAGNRMNAGTARGNAQAFDLTALRKLSDVKSTDGKTTLLHFVVEEVVRAEGKRCVINRKGNLSRNNSQAGSSQETAQSSEDREKEYIKLGLPIVGGLSSEFTSVKKAASTDYDILVKTISGLGLQVGEIRKLVQQCGSDNRGFVEEMRGFLSSADEELRVVGEEHSRVMEIVKRTTEYFQSGTTKDKGWQPLMIFSIVKDFLDLVDKACVDIARNLQKRKPVVGKNGGGGGAAAGSSLPESPKNRPAVKFPKLPSNFLSS